MSGHLNFYLDTRQSLTEKRPSGCKKSMLRKLVGSENMEKPFSSIAEACKKLHIVSLAFRFHD